MLIVEDTFVDEDIIKSYFVCDLNACKGACCANPDSKSGAPVTPDEEKKIANNYEFIAPFLSDESVAYLSKNEFAENGHTHLHENKECVYAVRNELGQINCGIEKAYETGKSDFKKPLFCHLAPIRVLDYEVEGHVFEALVYKHFEMCNPACELGSKIQIPLYKFLKEALERKFGTEWYLELEKTVASYEENK